MKKKFEKMNLSHHLKKAINDMGFESPTKIQSSAIPEILNGNDIIGQAQTGTGKTAAFAIPTLERLDNFNNEVQSLILCPTRELAIQVTKEYKKLGKYIDNLRVLPVYGGSSIGRQIKKLKKGVQIVVGTPGRTIDHIRRGTLKLDNINLVILDEADEMLNMGFREDIEYILGKCPHYRQTVLFSATMPREIKHIAKKYQKKSKLIKVNQKSLVTKHIDQYYIRIKNKNKYKALTKFLHAKDYRLTLIFSNTKRMTDKLSTQLKDDGFSADSLHGDMSQRERNSVMNRFRNRQIDILVATDVAARGLDVNDVDIVFNYDVPQNPEYYIHRIGRTGRAGKSGEAITFDSGRYKKTFRKIKKFNLRKTKVPTNNEIKKAKQERIINKISKTIDNNKLSNEMELIKKVMEKTDKSALEVAASLLAAHNNNKTATGNTDNVLHEQFKKSGGEAGMVRFFVNIGKSKRVRPKDFVGAISSEAKIPGNSIGAIDILNNFSFVEVPFEYGKKVLNAMNNNTIKGFDVNLEVANLR